MNVNTVLGKAIQALAKVGDEIYLEATETHFALRTVNISTTVFGVIKFLSPFFTHYKINDVDTQLPISQKEISCKMPTKALLGAFKLPLQMEKQVCCNYRIFFLSLYIYEIVIILGRNL